MTVPTFTEPSAPEKTTSTDDAPFGRKPNGEPYKRDPKQYASRTGRKRTATSAPTRKARPNVQNTAGRTQARAQAVFDVLTIPVAGLAGTGQAMNSKPLIADAIVLGKASSSISMAVAQVAEQDQRVADIVDKLVQTGPYAALFTALLPVAVQIGANHFPKFAEVAGLLGAVPVDAVIASATIPEGEDHS